jgi:hypothetical protein
MTAAFLLASFLSAALFAARQVDDLCVDLLGNRLQLRLANPAAVDLQIDAFNSNDCEARSPGSSAYVAAGTYKYFCHWVCSFQLISNNGKSPFFLP